VIVKNLLIIQILVLKYLVKLEREITSKEY